MPDDELTPARRSGVEAARAGDDGVLRVGVLPVEATIRDPALERGDRSAGRERVASPSTSAMWTNVPSGSRSVASRMPNGRGRGDVGEHRFDELLGLVWALRLGAMANDERGVPVVGGLWVTATTG